MAIQNLNLDQLPHVSSVFEATQNMDVGFILDASGVTAGNGQATAVLARVFSRTVRPCWSNLSTSSILRAPMQT